MKTKNNSNLDQMNGRYFTGIIGAALAIFLFLSYFIKINVDSGANYITKDSLLGVIIFHNIFVLIIYILIIVFLLYKSIKKCMK